MNRRHAPLADADAIRDVGDLRNAIVTACGDRGNVLHITTICGRKGDDTLCVVDFMPAADGVGHLAMRLGGQVFGMNSVVLNLSLGKEFRCPQGTPMASPHPCSCSTRT